MARKVRNYPNKKYYEEVINRYFAEHEEEVIDYTVNALGFNSFEDLKEAEHSMYFDFDCGFTKLVPKNAEMRREWILDEGGRVGQDFYSQLYPRFSWDCQSLTCKRPQAEKMLIDLELNNSFYIIEQLD